MQAPFLWFFLWGAGKGAGCPHITEPWATEPRPQPRPPFAPSASFTQISTQIPPISRQKRKVAQHHSVAGCGHPQARWHSAVSRSYFCRAGNTMSSCVAAGEAQKTGRQGQDPAGPGGEGRGAQHRGGPFLSTAARCAQGLPLPKAPVDWGCGFDPLLVSWSSPDPTETQAHMGALGWGWQGEVNLCSGSGSRGGEAFTRKARDTQDFRIGFLEFETFVCP